MHEPNPDEIADVYAFAMSHSRLQAVGPGPLAEAAGDSATDAVVWAVKNYDQGKGEFGPFARSAVRQFVRRRVAKERRRLRGRPVHYSLPTLDTGTFPHPAAGYLVAKPAHGVGELALPLAVKDLPSDLRDVVRLFYVDRFDIREIALLCGVAFETVRRRLVAAARILAGGIEVPARPGGEKRIRR